MTAVHGFGLRVPHYNQLLLEGAQVPVVEALTENFLGRGGRAHAVLERVRRDAEVVLHGVSMSIFDIDPLDESYLDGVKALAARIDARIVSDHASFGRVHGWRGYDLWPLPRVRPVLNHAVARISYVQERIGRRLVLENPSTYLSFRGDELAPWEFWSELLERSGCGMLLDLNNLAVDARNHGFVAETILDRLPASAVAQFHLGGHERREKYSFDDHASEVSEEVWALFRRAVHRFGPRPTIVEWDERIPSLDRLRAEARRIVDEMERAHDEHGSASTPPDRGGWSRAVEVVDAGPAFDLTALLRDWWTAVRSEPGPPALPPMVRGADGLSAEEAIGVYRRMYWYRQIDALFEIFPRTARALGGRVFTQLACRFIEQRPGIDWRLEHIGQSLATWLAVTSTVDKAVLDLVTLEWMRTEVLLAPNSERSLQPADLCVDTFPLSTMRFVESLRTVHVDGGVLAAWPRLDPDLPIAEGSSWIVAADGRSSVLVAVWRAHFAVEHQSLAEPEATALQQALAGAELSEVCGCFSGAVDPMRAAADAIGRWMARGWIAELIALEGSKGLDKSTFAPPRQSHGLASARGGATGNASEQP